MRLIWKGLLVLVLAFAAMPAGAQDPDMAGYYEQNRFLSAPSTVFGDGLYGFANPARPAVMGNQTAFIWTDDDRNGFSVDDWGVFSATGGLSTAFVRETPPELAVNTYHVGLGGGSKTGGFGVAYQWFTGDATALGRYNRFLTGIVARPAKYLSLGLVGAASVETDDWEAVAELGVRPLGTSRLTVFGDAALADDVRVADARWSAGAAAEVVDGIQLVGRFFEGESFSLGLRLDLGRAGAESAASYDTNGDYVNQVSRIRIGDYQPSAIVEWLRRDEEHVALELKGPVPYRTTRLSTLFGNEPTRFYTTLRGIREATESDRVRTVAVNLTGIQVGTEKAWELRRALQHARDRGKTVIVYAENPQMTDYYLASVADVVVLDPQGTVTLPGYALSRTFLDGTLDRLGLEFQEWRFFEYKSAAETLSRTGFSEADSLQRQLYVDAVYDTVVRGIAADRSLDRDTLDALIDTRLVLTAEEAVDAGLVDTLARWHDLSSMLEDRTGESTDRVGLSDLHEVATSTRTWGQPPKIAVVYGIGPTSMTEGIEARTLHKAIRKLKSDDDVAAVVFRVDSPGGDGMASDLVAQAVKEVSAEKPVIVTQGQVAASGGYWISAYADTILAGPTTVTGSIGVIGGWLYADGFSEKTGLTYDVVQRGERADLFTGYTIPLIGGPQIPTRALTDEEFDRVRDLFEQFYDGFVELVADGRDTTEAHVREVGEGRIYSGFDGKDVGLVDEIGGLQDAIDLARSAAGLRGETVEIVEVNPESGFWNLDGLLPFPFSRLVGGGDAETSAPDPSVTYIRLMLESQPAPLVLLPPGHYPVGAGR